MVVLEWRIEIEVRAEEMEKTIRAWISCKIKTDLGLPDPGDCPGEYTPAGYKYILYILNNILI